MILEQSNAVILEVIAPAVAVVNHLANSSENRAELVEAGFRVDRDAWLVADVVVEAVEDAALGFVGGVRNVVLVELDHFRVPCFGVVCVWRVNDSIIGQGVKRY